ncbi:hypothetical protein BGW80DRAFT_887818 [Lactifluus volemus]|nr:hypothetical protein BGW80DRAFT_887818 [Lactifluus volemus]
MVRSAQVGSIGDGSRSELYHPKNLPSLLAKTGKSFANSIRHLSHFPLHRPHHNADTTTTTTTTTTTPTTQADVSSNDYLSLATPPLLRQRVLTLQCSTQHLRSSTQAVYVSSYTTHAALETRSAQTFNAPAAHLSNSGSTATRAFLRACHNWMTRYSTFLTLVILSCAKPPRPCLS